LLNTELEIKNLSHYLSSSNSKNLVLKDIDLFIKQGELVGLLGPSGCGKTTLLRLIAGFDSPTQGTIKKNGQIISDGNYLLPPERRRIGMVFQDYALFPHLNVWENVCFGVAKKEQALRRAEWLLDLLGIDEYKNRYPHELSGGQSQRVALARALAPGTSLVLLDEPFCSLDVAVRSRLRSELSSVLRSCSASAILVTHDPHEALAICDRIAIMKNGVIQQYSNPSEIVSTPSNDFVATFVLQKNILPISFLNNLYSTVIGKLNLSENTLISRESVCIFDRKSVFIDYNSKGIFKVTAKEYRIDHFILTVTLEGFKIQVETDLNSVLNIGDMCNIKYLSGQEFLVLPEKIKSFF
tara:strand:- start:1207 stop:2268 length:1062 start_codon:yes stop_codon:yes gene_type:complete